MNTCSRSVRSLRMLLAMLGVVMGPAFVRGSPSATDSVVVAPAGANPVDAHAAPTSSHGSVSPAGALGIGLAATAAPTLLAYGLTGKDTQAEDITPSATAQGRRLSAGLGIRPDRVVTLNVRF